MKIIATRTKELNDLQKRCKYGIDQYLCKGFMKYFKESKEIKPLSAFGSCPLGSCLSCPQYAARKKQGNKKKTYELDWRTYRKVSSAAHLLIKESPHKTLFLTLTFPEFVGRHKYTKSFYYDEISNIKISQFLENLRTNHNCSGYIAVKEYGENTKRVHFHLFISYPYIDFRRFNDIWVHTISDICTYSRCAVRRAPGAPAIIRNPARAIRYVCKYINKARGQKSDTRIVFVSRNLLSYVISTREAQPDGKQKIIKTRVSAIKKQIHENGFNHMGYLSGYKSIYISTFDHVTVYKITDRKEFNKFCHKFLYALFECSVKWSEFYYEPG